jgi:hypothetical protein
MIYVMSQKIQVLGPLLRALVLSVVPDAVAKGHLSEGNLEILGRITGAASLLFLL